VLKILCDRVGVKVIPVVHVRGGEIQVEVRVLLESKTSSISEAAEVPKNFSQI
jgi:hypothetical protein